MKKQPISSRELASLLSTELSLNKTSENIVDKCAVFMPTYSPNGEVRDGFRTTTPEPYEKILGRTYTEAPEVPWTYLDAIDCIVATLGHEVQLVIADFGSSAAVQEVLRRHQEQLDLPNYELWLGKEPNSQWVPLNVFFQKYSNNLAVGHFIYTSSDVIWWQRNWLLECISEMRTHPRIGVTYPTVTKNDVYYLAYQQSYWREDKPSFEVTLANAYAAIFSRRFLETYDFRYPDVFRNCFTENFVNPMLKAVNMRQHVVPRACLHHFRGLDIWYLEGSPPSYFSAYGAGKERSLYESISKKLHEGMTKHKDRWPSVKQIKDNLYTPLSYYDAAIFNIYKNGKNHGVRKGLEYNDNNFGCN